VFNQLVLFVAIVAVVRRSAKLFVLLANAVLNTAGATANQNFVASAVNQSTVCAHPQEAQFHRHQVLAGLRLRLVSYTFNARTQELLLLHSMMVRLPTPLQLSRL
jgi:hypothetical protein